MNFVNSITKEKANRGLFSQHCLVILARVQIVRIPSSVILLYCS